MLSYNRLLEKSMFYDRPDDRDRQDQEAPKTNLTTDIEQDSSLMQGLSLMYQTSCMST